MDVGSVSHPLAVEALASALVETADAGQAVDAAGEAALGTLQAGTASATPGGQASALQIPGLAGLAEPPSPGEPDAL